MFSLLCSDLVFLLLKCLMFNVSDVFNADCFDVDWFNADWLNADGFNVDEFNTDWGM
jgi:hypothetical protein